jgi:hypothetical protein
MVAGRRYAEPLIPATKNALSAAGSPERKSARLLGVFYRGED